MLWNRLEDNLQQEGKDVKKVSTWMGDGDDVRPEYRGEKRG